MYYMLGSVCGTETVKLISAHMHLVVSNSLQPHGLYSLPGFSGHGISYTRNTGVGCHFLLQGDLPDPACVFSRQILDHWATREAVDFSNLCQRLLVLWHLHTVIICSHFEYIKLCLKAWAALEETPVFPIPSSPAVLTSSQMLVTEHHPYFLSITRDAAAAAAKSLQSCPTLCDPREGSPPGSAIPGILQARTVEWVAISFSSAWKWKVKVKSLSRVQLFATPWTAAHQAPLSMGFSRQEYWSGVPLPSPNRRRSSTFFSMFAAQVWWHPTVSMLCGFKKKSGVSKVLAWCLSQRSKVRCLPFAGLTHSPADLSWSGLRALSTISTIMVPKWVCPC